MVTSKIEPCNRKSVDNFFQNRQESDRATFKFIFTIPRTDRSGYRPCPSTEMIVLKHQFILHESPRPPSVRPLETTESVHSSAAYLCEKKYICEENSCWGLRPLSTRIRFDLKTQLFLYGYGFRPHESDENHQWKRNFSKTLTWVELFLWKHCFSVYVWTEQNGTFRKRWRHTISSKRWWTGASLSCLLSLGLFLTSNCLFSSKFSFVNSSSWLLQKVTEHYQVSFATGVKRRKVGSPFSLTLFLPWICHFKLFLRLWRTSQLYKPTPKKFKGGANLLFRGLIIANTYASSMRSRVSFRFQIDLSYRRIFVYTFCLINIYFWLCDDAKKI